MIKRIEFTLNLDDPREAAIYRALKPSLRYRRGGAVIRQALGRFLANDANSPQPPDHFKLQETILDEQA